jgi:hypothetical protein
VVKVPLQSATWDFHHGLLRDRGQTGVTALNAEIGYDSAIELSIFDA